MGRPRKTTAARKLSGNAGKRRALNEPAVDKTKMPAMPAHLDAEAKREWTRVAPELHRVGVLSVLDRTALAAYCQAWATWVHACDMLRKEGHVAESDKGNAYLNPWATVAGQALAELNRFGAPFGLTPGSRRKLDVKPAENEDEFVAFVRRK